MAIMVEMYGNAVIRHFPRGSFHYSAEYKKDLEAEDPELEKLFGETGFETESILEPGWISTIELKKQEPVRKAAEISTLEGESTIKLSMQGESTLQETTTAPEKIEIKNRINNN